MKIRVMTVVLALAFGLPSVPMFAAEAGSGVPPVKDIIDASQATMAKLRTSLATWTLSCKMPDGSVIELHVVRDRERQSIVLSKSVDGRAQDFCRILQQGGLWYVEEGNRQTKTKPYAATFHFPGAYALLSLASLRFIVDPSQLEGAQFKGESNGKLSYRVPLPPKSHRALEQLLSEYDEASRNDSSIGKNTNVASAMARVREQLTNGIPISVDRNTGIIMESTVGELPATVTDFRWLSSLPEGSLEVRKDVVWEDQSQPWPESDLEDCVLVAHDPTYIAASGPKLVLDGYILNLRTKELRRLPFEGLTMLPACFLTDRRDILVAGQGEAGSLGLVKVNVISGRNEALSYGQFSSGFNVMAELSPDGQRIATMRGFRNGAINQIQVQLIELNNGKARDLGKSGLLGGPFEWLPDGSGLILKRFEQQGASRGQERRVLCRLDMDGTLSDLWPGDWPVVLRKSRKILYQDDARLWNTCNLDGSEPHLFANGLSGYFMPAVSPDETKVIFVYYQKGRTPQLTLFKFGESTGEQVGPAGGFTTLPIWR